MGRALSRRNHGRSRAVVLATTHEEAVAGLRAIAAGKAHPTVISADAPAAKGAIWVLSGFGAQHRKMAKSLYLSNPVFAKAVDEVDALVLDEAGYSIKEMFLDDAQDYGIETCQVGMFAIQVGLAALLRHHGADAEAVVGPLAGRGRGRLHRGRSVPGGRGPGDLRPLAADGRGRGDVCPATTSD